MGKLKKTGYSVLELVTLVESIYNAIPDVKDHSSIEDVSGYVKNVLEFSRVASGLPEHASIREIELGLYELLIAANPELHDTSEAVHTNV